MEENKKNIKPKSKVQILFKNGSVVNLEVDKVELSCNGENVTKLNWVNASPHIMFISLPEILTILELQD
jgi:hypothetical protein